jgi:hypothetical protein
LNVNADARPSSFQIDAFYNNSIRPERTKFINRINRVLKRNYSILHQLMAEAEGEITKRSRDYLLGMGFRFEWYTSSVNQMPAIWYAVYDMYYRFDENDLNMISITRNRPSNFIKKKYIRLYARS